MYYKSAVIILSTFFISHIVNGLSLSQHNFFKDNNRTMREAIIAFDIAKNTKRENIFII